MFLTFVKTNDLIDNEYQVGKLDKDLQIYDMCQSSSAFQVLEIHNNQERNITMYILL